MASSGFIKYDTCCCDDYPVWVKWSTGTCCASDSTDTAETWYTWNTSNATYASSATAVKMWVKWVSDDNVQAYPRRKETAEARAAREEQERREREAYERRLAEHNRRMEEERKKLVAAEQRARELLVAHLDDEQRKELEEHKHFHVVTAEGERFRIDTAQRMHNVHRVDEAGKKLEEWCIYQSGETPMSDNHLAQKLLLEADPARFKKIANRRAMA